MEWFNNNLIETMLIIGIVLLTIEIVVLGFSTFFLFFAGLAAVATAVIMWAGLIPETYLWSLASTSTFTILFAALLWKRLRRMQKDVDYKRAKSDLIGHTFILTEDVDASLPMDQKPKYQYSGVNWCLSANEDLSKGTAVKVVQADVGNLTIEAK
jgi:membrane protein implicated in regulation of membrane protease activity